MTLTREQVLAMEPGRELDALVAEKVFGCQIHWEQTEWSDPYPIDERGFYVDLFSEGLLEAFEVVEKMNETHWFVLEKGLDKGSWRCTFGKYGGFESRATFADTAPLSITKAALLAVIDQ